MKGLAAILVGATMSFALTGCISSNQQSTNLERYTLTQDVAPQVFMSKQDVVVKISPALDMGGVMIELSDISLRPAQNFRYVNDLDKELRFLTIDRFMEKGFPTNYHTSIFISKFQGTLDGQVKVWAYIEVRNSRNKLVYRDEFREETQSQGDGYDPIVSALKSSYLSMIDTVIEEVMGKD